MTYVFLGFCTLVLLWLVYIVVSRVCERMDLFVEKDRYGDPWVKELGKARNEEAQRTNSFYNNRCPNCGCKDEMLGGPEGPGAKNYLCGACGSKFNHLIGIRIDLTRGCTDPIEELDNKVATHDQNGPINNCGPIRPGEWQCNCKRTPCHKLTAKSGASIPPPGARRRAIAATKAKRHAT